ncbi:hypothetical protein QT917_000755 [Xanthomonas campestris pv. campestris]|uniref:hypothetical protein n=1 Tax=Xanthomonas campestris TaxID=339 RepID=UPI0025A033BA|nr:hypothetical protein [Xanthomonas campestris]MDM7702388.1 hypothetical protein [Xanthomonas campestris pv. campestris]MEA0907766.1 hypothetical protein [Xanthomonas campestris pv. campestris]MEB1944856.1 hypothetical protein [Xanthomonas campestris pv. campestris]
MLKKAWNDPVWSKVIAASIIAAAGPATFFLGWWPAIIGSLRGAAYFLVDSTLPNWLTLFLGIVALPTIVVSAALLWRGMFPVPTLSIDWASYTSDIFFGLRWRWSYSGAYMSDPNVYCASCDYQVFPKHGFDYGSHSQIVFNCDSCGKQIAAFNESFDELQSKVTRLAHMKIRNKSFGAPAGA